MTDFVVTPLVSSSALNSPANGTQQAVCAEGDQKREARPLFDPKHPQFVAYHEELYCGFVYWPAYTVSEARLILGQSDDSVRRDFASGRYGLVRFSPAERRAAKPGERPMREWRQMWIPFPVLITYIRRLSSALTNHVSPRLRERRLRVRERFTPPANNDGTING